MALPQPVQGRVSVADARAGARVLEGGAARVVEEREGVAGERRQEHVGPAVAVDVARVDAHPGDGLAAVGERHAALEGRLGEGAVAVVHEQERGHGVVRDEHVAPAVAVEVGDADAHALADVGADAGSGRDVAEGAVAVVVEERVRQALVVLGPAVVGRRRVAAAGIGGAVPDARSWRRTGRAGRRGRSRRRRTAIAQSVPYFSSRRARPAALGHVGEGAVAVVAEERVAAQAGDEQVGVAVVVVVGGDDAQVVAPAGHARGLGHVGERAVAVVVVQAVPVAGPVLLERLDRRAVDDVDVEPAVVVVVEERDARDHRLRLVAPLRPARVGDEADPARVGALLEHDGVDPGGQRGGAGGEQQQQEGGVRGGAQGGTTLASARGGCQGLECREDTT